MPQPLTATANPHYILVLTICGLLCTLVPLGKAYAYNAITIDNGYGMDDTRLLRLNYSIGNERRYPTGKGWFWNYSWEGNLSYWYLHNHNDDDEKLFDIGLTPNFSLQPEQSWEWGYPYIDMGVGVHLLSETHIGSRNMGSSFQFGSHMAFGLRFGSYDQYELAWRIEHLSNAGIREPNPGINFSMVRFGYRW